MLPPRIEHLQEKKLVGKRLRMSLADNKTGALWASFMPLRAEVGNRISSDLISMRIYDEPMRAADPHQQFDKWAAVEVSHFQSVPPGMETVVLKGGLYAVFDYRGSSADNSIYVYIFRDWLPASGYRLDGRPQFEVLGPRYKNNDPDSEEEIWIPVRYKTPHDDSKAEV